MMILDPQFAEAANQFSGVIYQKSIEGVNGNVVISPLSILSAISFLMLGASGRTLSQMKSSLKYDDIEDAKFKMNFLSLIAHFEGENRVTVENKIFDIENGSKKPKFQGVATQIRLTNVETANELLEEDTKVILINYVSFNDKWKHDFDTSTIYMGNFFKNGRDATEVEYVTVEEYLNYGEFKDLDATAVQLNFKHSNVKMMILLPNSKTGLPELERKLHQINFSDLTQRMSREDIHVAIPKFHIDYKWNMNDPLKKMGMDNMFSSAAEFENLLKTTKPLKVSEVLHKTVLGITGKADKGAKVARLEVNTADCVSCTPKQFIADRPFLFSLIQDSTVIFMGRKVQ